MNGTRLPLSLRDHLDADVVGGVFVVLFPEVELLVAYEVSRAIGSVDEVEAEAGVEVITSLHGGGQWSGTNLLDSGLDCR